MNVADILVLVIVALLFFAALFYVRNAKKSGARCVGCPDSGYCGANDKSTEGNCSGQCAHCSCKNCH